MAGRSVRPAKLVEFAASPTLLTSRGVPVSIRFAERPVVWPVREADSPQMDHRMGDLRFDEFCRMHTQIEYYDEPRNFWHIQQNLTTYFGHDKHLLENALHYFRRTSSAEGKSPSTMSTR
jgi:hypothetical protein